MKHPSSIVGWREWVVLPDLSPHPVKAKVDTGARTSALHAEDVSVAKKGKKYIVTFTVLPHQDTRKDKVVCQAEMVDMRNVKSSNGHISKRPVIIMDVKVGDRMFPIELTLINRDIMGFRMLLGREAVRGEYLVDPGASFLQSRKPNKKMKGR